MLEPIAYSADSAHMGPGGLPDIIERHQLTPMTGALVIGGDYRGLGVVRSLGRHGIPVWVLKDEHGLAASSRYARRSFELARVR